MLVLRTLLFRNEIVEDDPSKLVGICSGLFAWLCALILLVGASVPGLHQRIDLVQREVIIVVIGCLFLMQVAFTTRTLKFEDEHCSTDQPMLLSLIMLVVGLHFCLPIRWCILAVSEFVAVASHGVLVNVFGNCDRSPLYM